LVALLWALEHLAAAPPFAVRIVLTADEEVDSPSGATIVREATAGALVFALEPPLPNGTLKVGRRGVGRERPITGREAHAGLDANLPGAAGIPTVDGLGPRGHGAHAEDETVELPSIVTRGRLLQALLTTPLP
jgi:acetylornithine deacetylase/succinyl-diaminopimelate desuccinylase-like protein